MEPLALPVLDAVAGRRSIRRFLPDPVDRTTVERILAAAARAPSGMNMQPWRVHVVQGLARDRLCRVVREAAARGETDLEYPYVPDPLVEPYRSRRRALGYALYGIQGIARGDMDARREAMLRNFDLFGAPVGIFVTMERQMAIGSWLDCGMLLQNIMLVARAHGLETCAQQSWCDLGTVTRRELGVRDEEILICGIALGRADPDAPENVLVSEREDLNVFVRWLD